MLKKSSFTRRGTVHGMPSLWRVDLLASINREEAEKKKSEVHQKGV